MAWADLLAGFAFYLIFEGLFPFAAPNHWRRALAALAGLPENQLRIMGLAVVIAGLALLLGVRG